MLASWWSSSAGPVMHAIGAADTSPPTPCLPPEPPACPTCTCLYAARHPLPWSVLLQAFAQVMLLQQEMIASLMGMLEAARGEAAATPAPITRPASPLKRRALESEQEAQARVRQDRCAHCLHSICVVLRWSVWQLESTGWGLQACQWWHPRAGRALCSQLLHYVSIAHDELFACVQGGPDSGASRCFHGTGRCLGTQHCTTAGGRAGGPHSGAALRAAAGSRCRCCCARAPAAAAGAQGAWPGGAC
jgi:hypothetical protein